MFSEVVSDRWNTTKKKGIEQTDSYVVIPGEDTKNKSVSFPVFMFMLLRSLLNLYLCLCCEWKSVFTARYISMCPSLLSGSLE